MKNFGKKQLTLHLQGAAGAHSRLNSPRWGLELKNRRRVSRPHLRGHRRHSTFRRCLQRMGELSIVIKDLQTQQSSLEDIFVSLVSERGA